MIMAIKFNSLSAQRWWTVVLLNLIQLNPQFFFHVSQKVFTIGKDDS
jgi:hypothetical protein